MSREGGQHAPAVSRTPPARERQPDRPMLRAAEPEAAQPAFVGAAGNLAIARTLAAYGVRAKMAVSVPGDPEEEEADKVAQAVAGGSSMPTIHRKCAACAAGEPCAECEEEKVHRKPAAAAPAPGGNNVHRAVAAIRTGGHPVPPQIRSAFEPRLRRDLSQVRIHTDATSGQAARGIGARAYTVGTDIAFAPGEFRPHDRDGQLLLAHEFAHALHGSSLGWAGIVSRQLDPGTAKSWDWYGSEEHRKDPGYLKTVAAAPGAATAAAKGFQDTKVPTTDAERDAFEKRVLALIRLNAVSMVGAHRNQIVERKQQFEQMAAKPPAADPSQSNANSPNNAAADTAKAIRAAAMADLKLKARKEKLEELRDAIAAAVRVNAGPETIEEEYQTLWDKAQPDSAPSVVPRLFAARNQLDTGKLAWGSKKVVLMDLRNDLKKFRVNQIQGIDMSLAVLFNAFPFLADLASTYITTGKKRSKAAAFGLGLAGMATPFGLPIAAKLAHDVFKKDEPPDDQTLLKEVQASFDRLIQNTDEAIVKVGKGESMGGIAELDLPGAVAAARASLPEALRPELDRLKEHHEAMKFAVEMVLALGIAVLTGLSGGLAGIGFAAWAAGAGAAAAGAGVAQLGVQLKDMADRQTLGAAATSPDKTLLGVSAPSTFEWAMLAVSAVLTAADLAALAREIAAIKPQFHEAPHAPAGTPEPKPGVKDEPKPSVKDEPKPGIKDEPKPPGALEPPEAGKVKPSGASEARILEGGKGDLAPSLEQIDAELAIVQRTEPRKLGPRGDYVEEVELGNGHTWRKTPTGQWCRFSNGRICVAAGPPKSTKDLIKTEADIDRLIEPQRPKLETPPPSVAKDEQALWELYNEYFRERVQSMRDDLRTTGGTKRDIPKTYESFKQTYTDNPELLAALRGRLAQGQTGSVITALTEGKVAQNVGVSKVAKPGVGEVVYPDFLMPRAKGGHTAITSKSRGIPTDISDAELKKIVMGDLREGIDKYYGTRYVRRRGLDVTGEPIRIDELVLNYDPTTVPEALRPKMREIAAAYEGVDVKVGFFEFK